jgi:acetyl esterase
MANMKPDFSRLHPQAVEYLKKMEAADAPPLSSIKPEQVPAVRREFNTGILQFLGPPVEMVSVRDITAATELRDIRLRIYTPHGTPPFPVFTFIHGGGWVFGNLETHDRHCRYISRFAECISVSVDYSPAPEHPFPVHAEIF